MAVSMDQFEKAEKLMPVMEVYPGDVLHNRYAAQVRAALASVLGDDEDDVLRFAKVTATDEGLTNDAWLLATRSGDAWLVYDRADEHGHPIPCIDLLSPSAATRVRYEFHRKPRVILVVAGRTIDFQWRNIREFEEGADAWIRQIARSLAGRPLE